MRTVDLSIAGLVQLEPQVYDDDRGSFFESYQRHRFAEAGIACEFVQDNHVISRQNVLRGMHFQRGPGQAKLVRVVVGEVFDVAVDMRRDSETFGKWAGVNLSADNRRQLFVPTGFAHGYVVLSDAAEVLYKVSSPYDAGLESGFAYDDPAVGIDWPVSSPLVSSRDTAAPSLKEVMAQLGESS